jgi:hypothetical protein
MTETRWHGLAVGQMGEGAEGGASMSRRISSVTGHGPIWAWELCLTADERHARP